MARQYRWDAMDKNIYSEMSNLRPKGRGRRIRGGSETRPPDQPHARTETEQTVPAGSNTNAGDTPAKLSYTQAAAAGSPHQASAMPPDSHLAASLAHLRERSTLGRDSPPAPAADAAPARPPTAPTSHEIKEMEALPVGEHSVTQHAATQHAATQHAPAPADGGSRRSRRKATRAAGTKEGIETPNQAPSPSSTAQPLNHKAAKRARQLRIKEAKDALADQRRDGKARVAAAEARSQSAEYLAATIPQGDFTRKETRQHLKRAKGQARAELAATKAQAKAAVSTAKQLVVAEKRNGRLWPRFERAGASHLADARVRSIRMGLAGSWIGLAAFAWLAWDAGELGTDDYWMPLVSGATGLLVLSITPWKRLRGRPFTSILVFLWLTMLLSIMVATAPYHESTLGLFIASIWIALYAGVLLALLGFALTAALTLGAFGAAVALGPVPVGQVEFGLYVAGLAMTTIIVGITVHELRSQAVRTAERLAELNAQSDSLRIRESELLQLYEVSRTIGAGEDMQQVLPELVARTAGYIGAKVGLVILYSPEEDELIALSPLWVAGQALEAEGYRFEAEGDSTAASVFGSGTVYVRNSLTDVDISRDQLLADLGVERVAAVPLHVEGQTIGVLLVADKATDFTEADIAALQLLSTPAGLVLNHLARYQEAQETGRRMSEVAQLKSDFVSVVSHELRTPLTSVLGALSTLARPELAPDNPVALSLIESASGQARRLRTLIEDLLTVSKIDNEALPIRLEVGDVGEILTRMISNVAAWGDYVELSLASRLPYVAIDADHFERVITNLLDNARKYANDSPIEVTTRAVDDEVWISVIDHGEGIPYEYEETIFERFTQIERADTRFKGGTGLGLNIVKDLTEAMNGRVWLEATPGSGATFTIALPRAAADAEATLQVGRGMLLVDPSRDRVEAPVDVNNLPTGGESPVAE